MPFANPSVREIAVLGAGTMGSQIAALFANAGFAVSLYDLADQEGKSSAAEKAKAILQQLEPSPIASAQCLARIVPSNYEKDLEALKKCALVIEAVAENMAIKRALYEKIEDFLRPDVMLLTNTSGLSINKLVEVLPKNLKRRFCGAHFFNPPRYLPLVELIAHANTDSDMLDDLETFLTRYLGKSIIRAKDTPNFIANRLGVFGLLITLYHAEDLKIPLEVVDQLTGKPLKHPKSATCRTMDVVGLDVVSHVVATMKAELHDDPWHAYFVMPKWLSGLIEKGMLGQKTKKGIYQKMAEGLYVWDIHAEHYRPASARANVEVLTILKTKDVKERFTALKNSSNNEAKFIWRIFRDLFHYAAYHGANIADTVRDIDLAMRFGFGWQEGIFELWQRLGWQNVLTWLEEELNEGKTLSHAPLPHWVKEINEVYQENRAYDFHDNVFMPRSALPVYARQLYPAAVLNERFNEGITLFENDGARVWTRDEATAIISFKTKLGTINEAVLIALKEAVKLSEANFNGLIIWQRQGEHFSAGADLMTLAERFMVGGKAALDDILKDFQDTFLALRYASIPVVAAVRGYVFGGGCELMMHCDKTVAAMESYIGLVETGVGIVPGAGGCKEMALRASQSQDPEKSLQQYFKQIGMAETAKSALEAKRMGYLHTDDIVLMNPDELLFVAHQVVKTLSEANYLPPLPPAIPAQGLPAKANLLGMLANLRAGNFISEYDHIIASRLADLLTGGNIDPSLVNEAWFLAKERDVFLSLVEDERTQARVQHMLENGKPLRN